ncbi:MAG: hypothetical protein KAH01_03845 [Caldisericia bacterium]|nr:hypothetical protein [Caldisericia bacterium]
MKKRKLRLTPFFIFIFLVSFLLIGGKYFTFVPLIRYSNNNNSSETLCKYIKENSTFGFIMNSSVQEIPFQRLLGDGYVSPIVNQNRFFSLNINTIEHIETNYLSINNFLYTCDSIGTLINIPGVSGSLTTKDIECLYVIHIKIADNSTENFLNTYRHKVRPFVNYLFHSTSELGPQIVSITYSKKDGLSFEKHAYNNKILTCHFGWDPNYTSMDFKLQETEKYLIAHPNKGTYSIVDLRFHSQSICSNPPPPPKEELLVNDSQVNPDKNDKKADSPVDKIITEEQ